MVSIPCPKCKSRTTHIARSRSPYIGNEPDMIFHCMTCGTRIYGPEKVNALVAAHQATVQAEQEREKQRVEEERRRIAEELAEQKRAETARRQAARRAAVEAEILKNAKCAWPPCPNDHTMTSKYCSRTCNNKNAHAKEKAKKEAAKALLSAG